MGRLSLGGLEAFKLKRRGAEETSFPYAQRLICFFLAALTVAGWRGATKHCLEAGMKRKMLCRNTPLA